MHRSRDVRAVWQWTIFHRGPVIANVRPTGSQPLAAELTRTPAETRAPTNALQTGREP